MTHAWKGDDNHLASKLNRNKAMQKHTALPVADGLYWYFENGESVPHPVMINKERWGQSMKSFNGAQQPWLREGEYLIGPQPAPQPQ